MAVNKFSAEEGEKKEKRKTCVCFFFFSLFSFLFYFFFMLRTEVAYFPVVGSDFYSVRKFGRYINLEFLAKMIQYLLWYD